jgi:hypothetical protein
MWTLPIYIFPTTIVIFTNFRANLEARGGTPWDRKPSTKKTIIIHIIFHGISTLKKVRDPGDLSF